MAGDQRAAPAETQRDEAARLSSWKAIAQYLDRDVRTVRRWETLEGLPVHRHQHLARSSVYAFTFELDAWRDTRPGPSRVRSPHPKASPWRRPLSYLTFGGALAVMLGTTGTLNLARRPPVVDSGRVRLAVMPFERLGAEPVRSPGADILLDELITRLGQVNPTALAVVGRSASRRFADDSGRHDARLQPHSDYVLEGSVRWSDDRVHVAVRLVEAAAQTVIWSHLYERHEADLITLPGEIARGTLAELGVAADRDPPAVGLGSTLGADAHRAYVIGRYHLNRRAGQRVKAREYFEQAIALDPGYAAGHAGLAEAFTRLAIFGPLAADDAWTRAERAARRAIELDERLAEAHVSMALVQLLHHFDGPAARRGFERAIELDAGNPDVHAAYALYLRSAGHTGAAIAERLRARDINPLRVDLTVQLAAEFAFARRYEEALAAYRAAQELEPHSPAPLDGLADTYQRLGQHDEAAAATTRLLHVRQQHAAAGEFEAVHQRDGFAAARVWLDRWWLARYSREPRRNAWNLAFTYARLGERDRALEWLERAYETRDSGILQMRVDPDVDSLRGEPRFRHVLEQLNLP